MTRTIRTIIVDDERLARRDLRTLLSEIPHIEVVGEADSVVTAVDLLKETKPDLIFLDIQMPGETGFDLFERTDLEAEVIFVTAFDEYALRAFEVEAVDYLLKPVDPERLRKALERIETGGTRHPIPRPPRRNLAYDDIMFLVVNTHPRFLRVNSIVLIQAAGDYSEVVTPGVRRGLVQRSMSEWEERLPEKYFCRIHRSAIVNMEFVDSIEETSASSYRIHLRGLETPVIMSRRYAARIRDRLG